jgi:hypothetical protein
MFGNLLGLPGGGRNNLNKDVLADIGPITLFDDEEAAADFTNHLHPQVAAATITQANQAGEGAQPSQPPLTNGGRRKLGGSATGEQEYSGIGSAILCLGHTMYDLAVIDIELSIQLAVDPGDATLCAAFRDFVINIQQFWVYLAMLGGQSCVIMVDTLGVYCSIRASASAYQGKLWHSLVTDELPKNPPQYASPP